VSISDIGDAILEERTRENMMRSITNALLIFACCLALGCGESSEERAQRIGPMLTQAGFHMAPADSPVRAQNLQDLPALKMNYFTHNGKPSYWWPDPVSCHCIYVGGQKSYNRYQKLKSQQLAQKEENEQDQEVTEEANQQKYMQFLTSPADQVFYGD
jgi:hypothetical protein